MNGVTVLGLSEHVDYWNRLGWRDPFHVDVNVPPALTTHAPVDLVVAVTEDHLVSDVQRGENRGRRLTHSAVVRTLVVAGILPPETRRWSATTSTAVEREWKSEDLKVIAFLQEQKTRHIIGAGLSSLAAGSKTL